MVHFVLQFLKRQDLLNVLARMMRPACDQVVRMQYFYHSIGAKSWFRFPENVWADKMHTSKAFFIFLSCNSYSVFEMTSSAFYPHSTAS